MGLSSLAHFAPCEIVEAMWGRGGAVRAWKSGDRRCGSAGVGFVDCGGDVRTAFGVGVGVARGFSAFLWRVGFSSAEVCPWDLVPLWILGQVW